MKQRRALGSGSLYQDKRGLWRGAFNAGYTKHGTRQRIVVSSRSYTEARQKLQAAMAAYTTGKLKPGRSPTIKTIAEAWIKTRAKRVRPATLAIENAAIDQYIIPLLGTKQLTKLTPSDVRQIGDQVLEDGRSGATAARYQSVFLRMLREAEADGLPVPRPIFTVEKTRVPKGKREAISNADALKLIEAASRAPAGVRWLLALMQGLRQGEALGLTWDAINLEEGTLQIEWQLQELRYKNPEDHAAGFRMPLQYEARQLAGGFHLVRPKSEAGRRVIPLTPWVAAALTRYKDAWEPNRWGLLFTHAGKPVSKHRDTAAWKVLQDTAGVTKTGGGHYVLHEARHTCATLLLAAGISPEIIKAIMGHSDIVTQAGYQHVSKTMARDALQDAERFLGIEYKDKDGQTRDAHD